MADQDAVVTIHMAASLDGYIARKFMKKADAGTIGINVPVPQQFAFFPLGSKNESAFGVAKSRIDSLRLFLDQKTVTER